MRRQVLVVDDAATIRLYHGSILRDAGFSVAEAANGYEALENAIERRYDLLVVDVNMPRMDGYAFVEAVRKDGPNQATPVVMVSTESGEADAQRAYVSGANVYLSKPVTGENLVAVAETLTAGSSR